MINIYRQPVKPNGVTAFGLIIRYEIIAGIAILIIAYALPAIMESIAQWIESGLGL